MNQDSVEQFERRFGELIRLVEDAQINLRVGHVPNLHNIEMEVTSLCKKVEGSSVDVAQKVQPLMGELIGRLDELAQNLMDYKQTAGR